MFSFRWRFKTICVKRVLFRVQSRLDGVLSQSAMEVSTLAVGTAPLTSVLVRTAWFSAEQALILSLSLAFLGLSVMKCRRLATELELKEEDLLTCSGPPSEETLGAFRRAIAAAQPVAPSPDTFRHAPPDVSWLPRAPSSPSGSIESSSADSDSFDAVESPERDPADFQAYICKSPSARRVRFRGRRRA